MSQTTQAKEALGDLEGRNLHGVDSIIRFLQVDEYDFGSGYLKERSWHLLKRVRLSESQKKGLRALAIRYLNRRMTREFWYMRRFMPLIADDAFRSQVDKLAISKETNVRQRALEAYLLISNKERTPDPVVGGKTLVGKRQGDKSPGMIFYNDQGDENGGLVFGGREKDGKSSAGAALLFDQFNQDQTIGIMYNEADGRRTAGFRVWDRPETPLVKSVDKLDAIMKMQDGPEKTEAIRKLRQAGELGASRVFVGKTDEKSAAVILSDALGRARIKMTVDAAGAARLEFLDEQGHTTNSFPR